MNQGENIRWYRTPLDAKTREELTKYSDWRGFRQMGQHLLLVTATGAAAFYAWYHLAWPWVLLALFLHGSFYTFLGMGVAGHELCHRTVFKTRAWNDFFLWIVSFIGWSNFIHFRTSHVKHHQVTVYTGLDLEVILPAKLSRSEWVYAFTFHVPGLFRAVARTIRLSCGRLEGEWEHRIFPATAVKLRRQLANCSRFVLITHVALAAMFVYFHLWIMLLLVTFAPFYATWLGLVCTFPQHAGLPSSVPDFRLCCRTMILNPFVSFLYWQMNYHVEHHMYAAVPFYNLRKLREVLKPDLPHAPRGLWTTWKELFPILKRQKVEPDYVFVPTVPAAKSA